MASPTYGTQIVAVGKTAEDAAFYFFSTLFPHMCFGTTPVDQLDEFKDLVDDLTTLYADYASSVLTSEYNRLRDDLAVRRDSLHTKQVFGPASSYHERLLESDDDEEDEEAEEDVHDEQEQEGEEIDE